jgi:acyl-coenzyme A thioesterase PaaI-like protein
MGAPGPLVNPILAKWQSLSRKPFGSWMFSFFLGRMARYTGTIGAHVRELRPGYCKVEMRDRAAVRNHLKSIHAIALMNLAEVSSGLATIAGLPGDTRSILTGLSIVYLKKARGTLVAEAEAPVLEVVDSRRELEIEAVIRDTAGDIVARATAKWLVGPAREGKT